MKRILCKREILKILKELIMKMFKINNKISEMRMIKI